MYKKKLLTGLLAALVLFMAGCKKDKANETTVFVSTVNITNITGASPTDPVSATAGGDVDVVGAESLTERGVCWATTPKPTTADNKTTSGTGIGHFSVNITGLTFATTYYVRAYAVNNGQPYYGNEVKFLASVPVELISNGEFTLPDDGVKYDASINAIPNWKTDETTDGITGREYDSWRNSGCAFVWDWAKPIYQVVGTVPSLESDYAIKFDSKISWNAWQDNYKPTLAVIFSAFTGTDPTARISIDTVEITEDQPYGPWPGPPDWGPSKTGSFSLPAASAFAGQNLVIELDVLPYDGGTFWSDVWYDFDNVSVIQTLK